MKILVVHNYYQHAGGEDTVFKTECAMLTQAGHEVIKWEVHNDTIDTSNLFGAIRVALNTLWNRGSCKTMRSLIRTHRPDVVHFHNTFPLISPSAYWACKKEGVPVVQTLHNYRLCCLNACLFRDGRICEKCFGKTPWWGVKHRCYRNSLGASMTLFMMLMVHRMLGTWRRKVDVYIALTEFGKQKMIEAGFPKEKIFVKPNAIVAATSPSPSKNEMGSGLDICTSQMYKPDPIQLNDGDGDVAATIVLYAGRLSPEKGVDVLLKAWKIFVPARRETRATLAIAGDGAERENLEALSQRLGLSVIFTGHLTRDRLHAAMKKSTILVVPSVCYETFGMSTAEGFMQGLPAIVPNTGAVAELVKDGITGWHFNTGDETDLADKLTIALSDTHRLHTMKATVHDWIQESDSIEERNVERLIEIYTGCIKR